MSEKIICFGDLDNSIVIISVELGVSSATMSSFVLFQVGVRITLASHGLTKMVVFTPYFVMLNEASVS